jgi:gliding motility-associated protein GldL
MSKEMNANEKKGFGARFMNWYGSYQGKRVVGMVYSIGAAVVIIGALFKIMHFPGAGAVLMVGMITEAILFMIGCLDKPHPEFHWHEVFPQLLGHGTEPELLKEMQARPKPTLMGGGAGSAEGAPAAGSANIPALSDKEVSALKEGIAGLAKTAAQLSELGKVATATTQLSEKLDAAGQAAEQFVVAGKAISEKSEVLSATYGQVAEDMKKVAAGTKDYEGQVAAAAKQMASLNAVYELQVNAVQAQVNAVQAQVETCKKMNDLSAEALKAQEAYEAGAKKLAAQVADLNKVYGNMLNALS